MERRPDVQVQSLARGLEILDLLLDADGPLTGGEIAQLVGLHESSVSRILRTLAQSGYVSRVKGGNVPALGMLRFARATQAFPLVGLARPVLEEIAAEHPRHHVNLCAYAHGELIYLIRTSAQGESVTGLSFPLHRSSAAMRVLVDLPEADALTALRSSRARYGWSGGSSLPADEVAALRWARDHLHHDVLVLDRWSEASVSGAIPVATTGHPLTLAIAGTDNTDAHALQLWLHDARRRLEEAIGPAVADRHQPTPRLEPHHPQTQSNDNPKRRTHA